jgi:hypothetical protein
MTMTTLYDHNDEMEPKDGSEEPPGRWHHPQVEMEMDVDVDSEDEVDRHLHINHINDHDDGEGDDTTRSRSAVPTDNVRMNHFDVEASPTRTIGITGSSGTHARTEVAGRKRTWLDRLRHRQIEPSAPEDTSTLGRHTKSHPNTNTELDPHRLPLPTTRSRSRPQSRASTPLLPGLSTFPISTSNSVPVSTSKNSNNEHENNRTAEFPGAEEVDLDPEESDGEGEKMCRICFTGEDDDDPSDSEAEDDAEDDPNQDQGEEKTKTGPKDEQEKREKHQKRKKERDTGPGSGLGRLISPCLCRGSMRVSSFPFLCQVSDVRFFSIVRGESRLRKREMPGGRG